MIHRWNNCSGICWFLPHWPPHSMRRFCRSRCSKRWRWTPNRPRRDYSAHWNQRDRTKLENRSKKAQKYLINLHLIFSSNLASANRIRPLNNSRASIKPLLSVSQIWKDSSLVPKICSNSVKSIENMSQTLLKDPWYSRSLARETGK